MNQIDAWSDPPLSEAAGTEPGKAGFDAFVQTLKNAIVESIPLIMTLKQAPSSSSIFEELARNATPIAVLPKQTVPGSFRLEYNEAATSHETGNRF